MSGTSGYLAYELRDGVLQDLVAIVCEHVEARGGLRAGAPHEEVDALLVRAQTTARGDLDQVRSMIDRLKPAA